MRIKREKGISWREDRMKEMKEEEIMSDEDERAMNGTVEIGRKDKRS